MRSILLGALSILFLAACAVGGGEDASGEEQDRSFAVGEIAVRGDGRILLAGVATRGDSDSEQDDYCRGDGPATSDFAVVHVTPAGRAVGDYSLSEDDLDGCAVRVTDAKLEDDGGLVLGGVIRESPGFSGEGGPESREHGYAARFDPEPDEVDLDEAGRDPIGDTAMAQVGIPGGDSVVLQEAPFRERRDADGNYSGTMSLQRWRRDRDRPTWSFPVRAISRGADLVYEDGRGWALFFDPRRGFYGFAHYSLVSGAVEVALFRHRPDGRPDLSFGDRGRILVAPDVRWSFGPKWAARMAGGDLVVAGAVGRRLVLRRYTPDGRRVPRFDQAAGQIQCGELSALVVDHEGRLVLACVSRGGSSLVRLLPDGRLDRDFGRNGKVVVPKI